MQAADEKSSDAPTRAPVPSLRSAEARTALTPLYKSPRRLLARENSDPYEQMMQSGTTILLLKEWNVAQADELLSYLKLRIDQRLDYFREGLHFRFLVDGPADEVRNILRQRLIHPLPVRAGTYTLQDVDCWSDQEILERPSSSRSMRDSP